MTGEPDVSDSDRSLDELFEHVLCLLEDELPVNAATLASEFHCAIERVDRAIALAASILAGAGLIPTEPLPRIAGFETIGEIGRGGMSVVYAARQHSLGGRVVALKVLPASVALSPSARRRFLDEARSIAKFRHPNIVAIHDVITESNVCAYAMELIDGAPLSSRIDQASDPAASEILDIASICRIGADIARALDTVHRAGLVHRDIKPSNILIRRDGTPLLSDFGLVRVVESSIHTADGTFLGTLAYAAPEQLRGDNSAVDHRADIYALGATLYHAFTRTRPVEGHTPVALLDQIERAAIPPIRRLRPECSRDIETVVAKAMEPDPSRRYHTASDLADDLERILSFRAIRASPAGLLTRAHRLTRRHRPSLLGAIAGAMAMFAAVALGWALLIKRPAIAQERLAEARLSLIDPSQGTKLALRLMWGDRPTPGDVLSGDLERSVALYEAAMALDPLASDAKRELAVIRAVARLANCETGLDELRAHEHAIPATARYATDFTMPDAWDVVSRADARDLGLMALLLGDIDAAVSAWTHAEHLGALDPFVEAALGQVHLWRGEPARAYPRLQHAAEAFPDVGFLHALLADSALQSGDTERAAQILDRAAAMGGQDFNHGLQRIRADLLAARGDPAGARALYQSIMGNNPVAALHLGRLQEAEGDPLAALHTYRADRFLIAESAERFLSLGAGRPGTNAEPGPLSPLPVWACLSFGAPNERAERLTLLRDGLRATRRLKEIEKKTEIDATPGQPTSAPTDGWAIVAHLAKQLEVDDMGLWKALNNQDARTRALSVTALLCGVPSTAVQSIVGVCRNLRGHGLLSGAAAISALAAGGVAHAGSCDPQDIFALQAPYGTGDGPQSVAIGDLDGDGDADLAVSNRDSDSIRVLLNNGDGTFAENIVYGAGDGPVSVIIGDLDGDGDADLAVVNVDGDNVSVLLNNGDGTFAHDGLYAVGDGPNSVAIGDLDGDGDADLAVANFFSDDVSVLLNIGDGTFAPDVTHGAGDAPDFVAIGDLNGNGNLDLAVANRNSNNVSVMLNTGDATFAPDVIYGAGEFPQSVAIGDLDGDGDADMVTANFNSDNISVLLNNGDGTFATDVIYGAGAGPFSVAIGDLNGDGGLDLAVANAFGDSVSVLLNNGDGTYAPDVTYGAGDGAFFVAIGDLDADSDADLIVTNYNDGTVGVLLNQCGGDSVPAAYTYDLDTDQLVSIDIATGDVTVIGSSGHEGLSVLGMTMHNGELWAAVNFDQLGRFDTTTGAFTIEGTFTLDSSPILTKSITSDGQSLIVGMAPEGLPTWQARVLARVDESGVATDVLATYPFDCAPGNCIDMDRIVADWTGTYLVRGVNGDTWSSFPDELFIFGAGGSFQILDKLEEFSDPTLNPNLGLDRYGDDLAGLFQPFPAGGATTLYFLEPDTGTVTPGVEIGSLGTYRGFAIASNNNNLNCVPGECAYTYDRDNEQLVTVDLVTGDVTVVGPSGQEVPFISDMTLHNGELWATVGRDELGHFDTTTGELTIVGTTTLDGVPTDSEGLTSDGQSLIVSLAPEGLPFNQTRILARIDETGTVTEVLAEYPFSCSPNNCIDMDAIVIDWTGNYIVRGMDAQFFGGSNAYGNGVFIFGGGDGGYTIIDKPEEFALDNFHSLYGLDQDGDVLAALLQPFPAGGPTSIYQIDPDTGEVFGSVEVNTISTLNGFAIMQPDVIVPDCPGDLDGDLDVDSDDLSILLGGFGGDSSGDIDEDGDTDSDDLGLLLGAFGNTCR